MLQSQRRSAGVDGQRFEDIEEYGLKRWLDEFKMWLEAPWKRPTSEGISIGIHATGIKERELPKEPQSADMWDPYLASLQNHLPAAEEKI
jgi:hypothetical protein